MAKRVLKILSYNIHKGFSLGNQNFILNHIKKTLHTFDADIVFLQEVVGENQSFSKKYSHWPTASQFEYLADTVWPHYAYGKNSIYDEGHHGNAILSRYPISDVSNLDISSSDFERRGALQGIIEIPLLNKKLQVLCVHFSLLERDRQNQLQQLLTKVASLNPADPLLIAGDFNDWRRQLSDPLAHQNILEVFKTLHGSHAKTFPSWIPWLSLDRIYYRGLTPISATCLTGPPWTQLSDHLALYAEIEIPD